MMRTRGILLVCLAALGVVLGHARPARAADGRFAGQLADGTRVAGDVANWHDPAQPPTVAGKPVLDAANPFRWVLDTTQRPPATPKAYVEYFTGDRIPGDVLGASDGSHGLVERAAPHLIVRADAAFSPADAGDDIVRVSTDGVQRVVWLSAAPDYRPGTAFLRDGRAMPFRSARWTENGVMLLVNDGVQPFSFADLAEVHLPRRDPWDAWFDALATLCPSGEGRLIQIETADGLRATTSTERLRPQVRGDKAKPEHWIHLIQPAWALDPLWVRFRTVRGWRFASPKQVWLTSLAPAAVAQESYFAASSRWQRDRSAAGTALGLEDQPFPAGFGVHARNELSFELHPAVRSFRTGVALNQAAREGGCAVGQIALETDQRRPLFQSQPLVGSKAVVDSGVLSVAVGTGKTARLVLIADPMIEGRPAGADPLDIRDFVDWLQPEFELDPAAVKAEISRRAASRIAALAGWTISPADLEHIQLTNHWDESNTRDARFRLLASTDLPFLSATSKLRIDRSQRWLAVSATRPPTKTTPVRLFVKIDGTAVADFEVPAHASPALPDPVLIPVAAWQGKTVTVELAQFSEKPDGAVDWRGVSLLGRRPGLLKIFDDEKQFPDHLHDGDGDVTLSPDKPHRGDASLRVTAPGKGNSRLPGLDAAIREHPAFGEYRYLRFAWKIEGGSQVALSLAHDGQFGGDTDAKRPRLVPGNKLPLKAARDRRGMLLDNRGLQLGYRYDAGKGPPLSGAAIRLGGPEPNWVEVTRDLFADLGTFTLTGLQFGCPDGDATWFDAIYLGRTVQDFDAIRDAQPMPKPAADAGDPLIAFKPTDRADLAAALGPVAAFHTPSPHEGVALLKEIRGRKQVARIFPPDGKTPFLLRSLVTLPEKKPAKLTLEVGHDPEAEWQLVVTANGQTLHDGQVSAATTKDGWLNLTIDLARVAGQHAIITIEQRPVKETRAAAFWSKAALTIGP